MLFGIELDLLRGLVLVALILAFGGVWAWAWSSKRRDAFHEASRLPLEEDDGRVPVSGRTQGTKE